MSKMIFLDTEGRVRPPPKRLLLKEVRGLLKPRPRLSRIPALAKAPRGDGHPVFVLPGFLTSDTRTRRLRKFLRGLGYAVYGWEMGVNLGPTDRVLAGVERRFREIRQKHGCTITVIGHSLGGVIARDLAKRFPEDVRQLVTLGSPIHLPTATNVAGFFRLVSRFHPMALDRTLEEVNRPPPAAVPVTALYTRSDGIVAWQSCLEAEGSSRENIEVESDHSTLPSNLHTLLIVADRLAQPEGAWRPYRAG
jgi:pimeloyl-ACP methyl ester carboxylesterase